MICICNSSMCSQTLQKRNHGTHKLCVGALQLLEAGDLSHNGSKLVDRPLQLMFGRELLARNNNSRRRRNSNSSGSRNSSTGVEKRRSYKERQRQLVDRWIRLSQWWVPQHLWATQPNTLQQECTRGIKFMLQFGFPLEVKKKNSVTHTFASFEKSRNTSGNMFTVRKTLVRPQKSRSSEPK